MTVIGVTGPSGAGKGEVSRILQNKYEFAVIDADGIYHSLVSAPSPCLDEIIFHFGKDVINSSGALDRQVLGKLVLGESNREKLLLLNDITHKYVVKEIQDKIKYYSRGKTNCVIDAPLLIEAGLGNDCDFTVSVLADDCVRIERISKRDKISMHDAKIRISSQKIDDFYISNTDYSIVNNGDICLLEASVSRILSERRVIN